MATIVDTDFFGDDVVTETSEEIGFNISEREGWNKALSILEAGGNTVIAAHRKDYDSRADFFEAAVSKNGVVEFNTAVDKLVRVPVKSTADATKGQMLPGYQVKQSNKTGSLRFFHSVNHKDSAAQTTFAVFGTPYILRMPFGTVEWLKKDNGRIGISISGNLAFLDKLMSSIVEADTAAKLAAEEAKLAAEAAEAAAKLAAEGTKQAA